MDPDLGRVAGDIEQFVGEERWIDAINPGRIGGNQWFPIQAQGCVVVTDGDRVPVANGQHSIAERGQRGIIDRDAGAQNARRWSDPNLC